jgi:hypothetical protein
LLRKYRQGIGAMSKSTYPDGLNTQAGKAQQKGLSKNAKRQLQRYGIPSKREGVDAIGLPLWSQDEKLLEGTPSQWAVACQLRGRDLERIRQSHIHAGSSNMERIFEGVIPRDLLKE